MHILILNWRDPVNPTSGGAEIVTKKHASYWVKKGHAVTWFASSFMHSTENETIDGITIIRRGSIYTVHWYAFLHYIAHSKIYDVVVDEIHGIPFFTPLYVRKPILTFIHEVAGNIWDHVVPYPINIIGKTFELLFLRLYRRYPLWTDAQSTVDELRAIGFDAGRCIAIPCPPESASLAKAPKKKRVPAFIFVSRIVQMKGVEDILHAFACIVRALPDAQLSVIGGGDARYIKKLHLLSTKLGIDSHVAFHGYVTNKKKLELMKVSHILLHASIKEGWGLVVVEAASQWTPSVVYNVSGLRDCVHAGKTGIVVSENTPQKLAEAAIGLYKDEDTYRKFQRAGVNWVKSLRWDSVTKQSLTLIESI